MLDSVRPALLRGCGDRRTSSLRESNPRFFKAENALADVLAHDKISLRDVFYINGLRPIFDSAPGTILLRAKLRMRGAVGGQRRHRTIPPGSSSTSANREDRAPVN